MEFGNIIQEKHWEANLGEVAEVFIHDVAVVYKFTPWLTKYPTFQDQMFICKITKKSKEERGKDETRHKMFSKSIRKLIG